MAAERRTTEEWITFHYHNHQDAATGEHLPLLVRADNIDFIDKSAKDGVVLLHFKNGGIIPLHEKFDKATDLVKASSRREKLVWHFVPDPKN